MMNFVNCMGLKKMFFLFFLIIFGMNNSFCKADNHSDRLKRKAEKAAQAFAEEASKENAYSFKFDSIAIDFNQKEIVLYMNSVFSYIPFRTESVSKYHSDFEGKLGRTFRSFSVRIESMGLEISELIPNYYRNGIINQAKDRLELIHGKSVPLVQNMNEVNVPVFGLKNKHIALWHSHGWYYENTLDRWEWQRARVFTTVEDLWTMEFVVPYIAPMLENAGANVLLPRERDVQRNEVIVDSDWSSKGSEYIEMNSDWQVGMQAGFANKYPFFWKVKIPLNWEKVNKQSQIRLKLQKFNTSLTLLKKGNMQFTFLIPMIVKMQPMFIIQSIIWEEKLNFW